MDKQLHNLLTRREFLRRAAILGLSATSAALLDGCGILPAPAPTPTRIPRIGILAGGSASGTPSLFILGFQRGLNDLGYVEGKNIEIVYRFAEGNAERLPALASELVALNVNILVVSNTPPALAARKASSTIPIVFAGVGDPVGAGLVGSLSHPGGNVTGLTTYSPFLDGKRLEIFKETIPGLSQVAVSWDPTNPTNVSDLKETQEAAKQFGLKLQSLEVKKLDDVDAALALAISNHAEALFSLDSGTNTSIRIAELATKSRLPSSFKFREAVDAGGVMSYGTNINDLYRREAIYVDKLLNGAKPANLPIEAPTKFDFVINLKTAKALSLTIPQSVLAQATEVIQ